MTPQEKAAAIEEIRGLIGDLTEQMRMPAPPVLRQEQERQLGLAEMVLGGLQAEGDLEEAIRGEVGEHMRKMPTPRALKSPARLKAATPYVHVVRDIEPWQVWVQWDAVPPSIADDVVSLASFWRDIIAGRPVGPPRKTRHRIEGPL